MTDADLTPAVEAAPEKPARKKSAKAAAAEPSGKRDWKVVVADIRRLREEGLTVPAIADQLNVPYVLVNQVMVQSYKMSIDTISVFERHEENRLAAE